MKFVITGASGFVGTNLCRFLKANGHQVVAIVRSDKSAKGLGATGVDIFIADVTNTQTLNEAFRGADVVIHLAALFNHPEASWEDYRRVNIQGTHNIMRAAIRCDVPRVVHCSTVGVATGTGKMPYSESTPYSPPHWDKYETTKCEGEKAALGYHRERNIAVAVIRPAQVFGPGDISKAKFYRLVKKGVIVNPGKTRKHLIYIDDLCHAFELAATHSNAPGEVFIIGNPSAISLKELIKLVASELKVKSPSIIIPASPVTWLCAAVEMAANAIRVKPPIFRRSMDFFTKSVEFDVSKARQLLGFEGRTSVSDAVSCTAAWYAAHNLV